MSRASKMLLCAALLLVTSGVIACGGGGDDVTTPLDRDVLLPEQLVPEIQVQSVDHLYRYAALSDDNLDPDPIFSLISSASSSLDIAMTRINRQEVVDALLAEARTGTQIRIVTEKAYYDAANYRPFYAQLEDPSLNEGNIRIRTDDDGLPRLMHARFLVIDQARVVTGSYNWETVNSEKTFGDVINILNTSVAAAFTSQFNQMFVEGNFGVHKRDDTQHSFIVGGGNGLLEVYFGPYDQPRDRLQTEISQSSSIAFAIEQFQDLTLANFLLGWASNPQSVMVGLFNDFGSLGTAAENAVYDAFYDAATNEEFAGGSLYINVGIDPLGNFDGYNIMNHKLMFCDRALVGGDPTMIFTTSNYSDLGLTLNDEVMLIMRGLPLVSKYWRGLDLTNTLPPQVLVQPGDVQEFDQLFVMWPYVTNSGTLLRDFPDVPCGIVYGDVDNFRETVTIQEQAGEFTDIDIDLTFEIEGSLFFGGGDYGPLVPTIAGDMFVRSELINPDHRYLLVVPAGEVTIRTVVVDLSGSTNLLFEPDETTFNIGPGGVKHVNLQINQAPQTGGAPGGGTGGDGGGGIA